MIYLDNCATTRFKPDCVTAAVSDALQNGANPGRSGHPPAIAAAANVLAARESLCAFADAPHAQCIFGLNCTHALNLAIFGAIDHGHVITTSAEHNSVLRPLYALACKSRIRLTVLSPCPNGDVTLEQVKKATASDTTAIVMNMVSNVTGHCQSELAAIGAYCRVRNLLFVADGAQAVGYIPVSVRKSCIDLLAVAPHKGLHAPMGVGALIVGDRVKLRPVLLGGTGTDSRNPAQVPILPEGIESGTLPYPAICGLLTAVDWTRAHLEESQKTNLRLTETFLDGLKARRIPVYAHPNTSGIVSFNLPGFSSARAADALGDAEICVRGGLHCAPLMHDYLGTSPDGAVRASFSIDNTPEEIDAVLSAIDRIGKNAGRS